MNSHSLDDTPWEQYIPINTPVLWTYIAWEGKEILLTTTESRSFVYVQYNYRRRIVLVDGCRFRSLRAGQFWDGISF